MNKFNEATRVQMPAMVHLTRLGYTYFGKISEEQAGTIYDPDTNILLEVFKNKFIDLNPLAKGEFEQTLRTIRQELDNDDLGKSFYNRLKAVSPIKLIDFEYPQNNVYHFTAEYTCKNGQEEFNQRMVNYKTELTQQFAESHRLENEIMKQLDSLVFNANTGK